jgi:large subunit ribosomal protein L21
MVDHSSAYQDAMTSSHGVQLQLALEEGRGKDDKPFDPFSQFLDGMGSTADGDFEDDDEIEEAEYTDLQSKSDDDDDDDDNNDVDEVGNEGGPIYTTTGALYRPKSERLALRAGYPAGGTFAVIHLAGFQHKITIDDLLVVNKLKPASSWSVGSTHTIKNHDVLLMADQEKTLVGLPGVMGGEVDVMVEEITRDKTVVVFKKRRRKNSRRKNGFRREVTFLRVLDVRMPKEIAKIIQHTRGDGFDSDEDVRVAA